MYSINWASIQNRTLDGTAWISCTLNALLIFLILQKSPKKLGAYKYLMIGVAVFQTFYSVVDVVVSPVFHSHGSRFTIFVDLRHSMFSKKVAEVGIAIYCGCFGFSMAIFGINFIYRYLVASGSQLLVKFNNWKVVTWFVIPLIYGFVWGCVAYFFCGPYEAVDDYMRSNILETYDIKLEDLTYLGISLYQTDESGQARISEKAALSLGIFSIEMITSLFTIFYFATKCFFRISSLFEASSFSARHVGLQFQLFHALIAQTIIPVLLMHLPVSAMFIFTAFNWELGVASAIVPITVSFYPVIDPLPTFLIVRNYRKGLYEYYSKISQRIFCQSR